MHGDFGCGKLAFMFDEYRMTAMKMTARNMSRMRKLHQKKTTTTIWTRTK